MKPLPLFFVGSLAANAALLVTLAFKPALAPPKFRDFFQGLGVSSAPAAGGAKSRSASRPYVAPKPDAKPLWTTLQSADLRGLVANLRAAGFSPAVIRAIVSAQIEIQFRSRMKELVGTVADTPFWKPESGLSSLNSKLFEAYNQVYRDRARLTREVLGDDFFASAGTDRADALRRQYGDIPKSKLDLVQRVNEDYQEMTQQVRAATQGITLPEDREKIALLEKEKRADLAAILTPAELEDYLMHTSQITMRLRTPLSIMDATEAEFRTIYQIQLPFQETLYPGASLGGITTITSDIMTSRQDAQKQMQDQIKAALGEARGAEFVRASDSEFQNLYRLAQRENVSVDAAVRAYNLRESAAAQSMQIFDDKAMNVEQKRAAMTTLAQTTKSELIGALGVNAGNAYAKSANWLTQIERGAGVSFNPGGGMRSRMLPPPRN